MTGCPAAYCIRCGSPVRVNCAPELVTFGLLASGVLVGGEACTVPCLCRNAVSQPARAPKLAGNQHQWFPHNQLRAFVWNNNTGLPCVRPYPLSALKTQHASMYPLV